VYIDSSRGVCLGISNTHVLSFNQMNPSITFSFSIALLPYHSTAYSALHYIVFYTDKKFQYFSLSNIVFLSLGK
jgi:hypothetical protein